MAAPAALPDQPEPSAAELIAARPQLRMDALDGLLFDGVPLAAIVRGLGTPAWVYSAPSMRARLADLAAAFAGQRATIHYAVKANDHLAVLRDLLPRRRRRRRGQRRRAPPRPPGRHPRRPHRLLRRRQVRPPNSAWRSKRTSARSTSRAPAELQTLAQIATTMGRTANVALRINPDVDAGTHAKITTGRADNKFGIPYNDAAALYAHAATLPGIRPVGLALHIGSQIVAMAPYRAAFARAAELIRSLRASGLEVTRMDCGGGLGIGYQAAASASPAAFAGAIRACFGGMELDLAIEPGRWLVAPAGVLLARVVLVKGRFTVLDAAMNDLLRPAMYDAWHGIVPLSPLAPGPDRPTDFVGPVCESGDSFARNRPSPPLAAGDAVALLDAGAYGAVMSSTYNARPLPPIALIDAGGWSVIRPRQTHAALWADESIPAHLS